MARLIWSGLEELKAALRAMPSDLAAEASHIIEARANSATQTIKAGYAVAAGDLRDKLEVTHSRTPYGARSVVYSGSAHADEFELGTQLRHYRGWSRGVMPANPLFTQTIRRERRGMYEDFKTLLTRHGLLVSGDA